MLIFVQKINFITQFFKILQRNTKLAFFGWFRHAWSHTPKMIIAIWRYLLHISVGKRSSSSFRFSLRYYKDIVNLMFWVLWACLTTQTQNDTINLKKTFVFICRQKINFSPSHAFLEILRRYGNFLFCVLWAYLVAHTQNDSINL